jgi:hypothetical protein
MGTKKTQITCPVVEEKSVQYGSAQEKVQLPTGEILTRKRARELYNQARKQLRSYADLILVSNAMQMAQISLSWELTRLKEIADQNKDLKSALQSLGMIRLIREAAVQGVGSGGARMSAKEADLYSEQHAGEVINIVGAIRQTITVHERSQMDNKMARLEVINTAVSGEEDQYDGDTGTIGGD